MNSGNGYGRLFRRRRFPKVAWGASCDRGSAGPSAISGRACAQRARSDAGATQLRVLHDRSKAREVDRRQRLRQGPPGIRCRSDFRPNCRPQGRPTAFLKGSLQMPRLLGIRNPAKQGLSILFWFSCLISSAYGQEYVGGVSIQRESIENGSATSVGVYGESFDMVYLGVSLTGITSSTPIQSGNRTSILPAYFFVGLKAPWKLAPYIEAGTDLVDQLFDELGGSESETKPGEDVDYYFAAGVKYSITDRFILSLYAKEYALKFREDKNAPRNRVSPGGYGIGVSMRF